MAALAASRSRWRRAESSSSGSRSSVRASALQPAVPPAVSTSPSSWTSRSRTEPRRRPNQPSSSRKTCALTGSTPEKSASAARKRRRRYPHVVQLFWVLTEACPRLLVPQDAELPSNDCESQLAHGAVGVDRRRPEVGGAGDLLTECQQTRLELGQVRRPQATRRAELLDQRLERLEPLWEHLHLDPPQLHWPLAVSDNDDRVVERNLGGVRAADAQGKGPTPRPDLEHLVHVSRTDDGAQSSSHGSVGSEGGKPRRRKDLGDLESLAQSVAPSRPRVLQRDLVVAAPASRARDEAGASDAPVVGVEVGVDEATRGARQGRDRPEVTGLGRERGQRGEPSFDGAKVERVELPLDLDGVLRLCLPRSGSPRIGHCVQATAGSEPGALGRRRRDAGQRRLVLAPCRLPDPPGRTRTAIAADSTGRGSSVPISGATGDDG